MRPGRLKQRVTLQQRVETTTNDFNEVEESWSIYAYRWAQVQPITGKEYMQAQSVHADVTHRIVVRSDPDTLDLTPKWRIGLEGTTRVFDIASVRNIDEGDRMIEIMAMEAV